jgi:hypothetical protein
MARADQVLTMLIPNGGWIATGDDFEGIEFIDCEPITKKQFTDGFAKYDDWKAKQDSDAALNKAALLTKLGITSEEAALLLS